MNKEKTLYIIGSISLPRIDAGASRVIELSKGFSNYFDKIIVAGKYNSEPHQLYHYEQKIYFLPYHKVDTDGLLDKITLIFKPYRFILSDLSKSIELYNVTHILIYSALETKTVKKIKKIANAHNIKIIYDIVEYQTLSQQTLTSFFSFYLPNTRLNKRIIKKGDNVISISTYLHDYFLSKGCNSALIPFVFDVSDIDVAKRNKGENGIRLMYAGSPKKQKDLLINCLKGLSLLPSDILARVHFNIAGITENQFFRNYNLPKKTYEKIKDNVLFMGKITNSEVEELYKNSDFSVLIRDENSRLSKAGFPTKISESLAHGVPVICNLTSDLNLYLENDYNALIMKDSSPEEMSRCIIASIKKSSDELELMRKNSRETSISKLDIHLFDEEIKKIL